MVALQKIEPQITKPLNRLGVAELTRYAYSGKDLTEIASKILIASSETKENAGLLLDLSIVEQLKGNQDAGLLYQRAALIKHNLFRSVKTKGGKLRLLVLAAPIHMGGNTPVEMLLRDADVEILTVFIAPGLPIPAQLPEHDLVMITAPGDSGSIVSIMPGITPKDFLKEIQIFLAGSTIPVINRAEPIFKLERDALPSTLGNINGVVVPKTLRCGIDHLTRSVIEETPIQNGNIAMEYPFVIRPVGSHAGFGFEKISNARALGEYLRKFSFEEYFLSNLIDYRSSDGQFRKYRIMFIDGVAYPCHMAIGEDWKLWYLNAHMDASKEKRDEEAAWMKSFPVFARGKLKSQFEAIAKQIDLDYFGIDCAIDNTGNLVVFEADNAMIAHDMDPADIYPYKKPTMKVLFKAFETMLFNRVEKQQSPSLSNASELETEKRWVRVK